MTLDPTGRGDWTHRGCPWGIRFLVCSSAWSSDSYVLCTAVCLHGPPKTSALCTAPLSLWGLLRVPHGLPKFCCEPLPAPDVPAALPVGTPEPGPGTCSRAQPLLLTAFTMIGVNGGPVPKAGKRSNELEKSRLSYSFQNAEGHMPWPWHLAFSGP